MKPRRKTFPPSVYRAILRRQRNICACGCREKLTDIKDVQFDHIEEIADGGEDTPENLQALKRNHHAKKTGRNIKRRAKEKRIREQNGLMKPKMSQRRKLLNRYLGLGTSA